MNWTKSKREWNEKMDCYEEVTVSIFGDTLVDYWTGNGRYIGCEVNGKQSLSLSFWHIGLACQEFINAVREAFRIFK